MSLNSARINLFTYLNTNWTTTPIVFEGQKTGDTYIKTSDPWIYAYILWGSQFQKSAVSSQTYYSTPGILTIRMFIKESDGIAKKDIYTDSLFTLFRGKTINSMIITGLNIDRDYTDQDWMIREISFNYLLRTVETIS